MDGAVLNAQEEAAHWDPGLAIPASAVAAISATLTAAAAWEAAAAPERREVAAAAGKQRLLAKPALPSRLWRRKRRR